MGKWMAIDNKQELIRKHAATPAMAQAQLAKWAKKEFRLRDPPARSTTGSRAGGPLEFTVLNFREYG
ncbi:hypothetical protein PF003_g13055 [Phytophthora fragariae]|nr:hypothetical protein PF003_g13055 [Phytophthora fragariae]